MSNLIDQIQKDIHDAMRAKDELRLSTLRLLKSAIKHLEIDQKGEALTDAQVTLTIRKQVKQRMDSAAEYQKANRDELAQKEKAEVEILNVYLPEPLADAQVDALIQTVLKNNQISSMKEFGKAMKLLQVAAEGRVDNKLISEKLRKVL
ncbi:MAG: hypothetical protein ACI9CF_000295 [Candidatus Omnitrophota bacterium]|jgi:uncharacterized protein YqeY